jgi:hypothetical protein
MSEDNIKFSFPENLPKCIKPKSIEPKHRKDDKVLPVYKETHVTVYVRTEIKKAVDRYKRRYYRTFSDLINDLLKEWLEKLPEEEANKMN